MTTRRRLLGVNIDHVATLRQQRHTLYPDPVQAAAVVETAGADQITIHVREDRRHIQDRDAKLLRQTVQSLLNVEMAATGDMQKMAFELKPDLVTLVPERREELTTEGGLDVNHHKDSFKKYVQALQDADIPVSLFIDPDVEQVKASHRVDARSVEIHTGKYCDAKTPKERDKELNRIVDAARTAAKLGMRVAAGHGLNYHNLRPLVQIDEIAEYNIGHAIVAHALFVGLDRAVKDMLSLLSY